MIGRPPRCLVCHRTAHLILRDGPPICRPCVWEAVDAALGVVVMTDQGERRLVDADSLHPISLDELLRRLGVRPHRDEPETASERRFSKKVIAAMFGLDDDGAAAMGAIP